MSEALFFPKKPAEPIDTKHLEAEVNKAYHVMHAYLHTRTDDGVVKTKLHDQLIWLQYQIKYFTHSHDVEHLLENFNWVVANFNHDLSLSEGQSFMNYIK